MDIMHKLYYLMEDWVGNRDLQDEKTHELEIQVEALQDKIILRLGEDGQDMMETLADLNLKLETIHDEALFRAAMGLGAQIAQPAAQPADTARPYSTSL